MSAVRREPTLLNPPRASCHHQHASFSLRVMQHYFPERGRGLLCLFWSASVTLRLDSGRKLPSFFYPEIAASHGDVQTLLLWLVCNRKSYSVTSCYVMTLPTTRCCTALCKQARRKVRRCKGSHLTAVCVCVCLHACYRAWEQIRAVFLLVVHGVLWTLSTYCSPAQVLGGDVTAVQKAHQSQWSCG